jgi:formate hydrogenlyase subunit 3/multisubunit Na+/H+ antiporter MnhD subunit
MMEKLTAALTLLGIVVVLILVARASRNYNNQGYKDPSVEKSKMSPLREVATALPKVILAVIGIFAGLIGVWVIVALLPISDKESVAAFVAVAVGLAMASFLTRWFWRETRRRRTLQPWEHHSVNYGKTMRLRNKIAIVTRATSSVGLACLKAIPVVPRQRDPIL